MSKRTPDNCSLIKRHGEPERSDGKCIGFAVSEINDEPCEDCKKCKYNTAYEPEY